MVRRIQELEEKLAARIEEQRAAVNVQFPEAEIVQSVLKCPKCDSDMLLKKRNNQTGFYISCCGFPGCRNAIWLPSSIEHAEVTPNSCRIVSFFLLTFIYLQCSLMNETIGFSSSQYTRFFFSVVIIRRK